MAFERAEVFEVGQIGIETTLLTTVAATKKLTGTSILNKIMTEVGTFGARGSRFNTVGIENREWTEATWTADTATYTEPAYPISLMLGAPNISTPGGGSATRDLDWDPTSFSGINPKSATLENANFVRSGESGGHTVKTLGFDFNRDGVSMSAESFGGLYVDGTTATPGTNEVQTITASGTVSGGTYTISFYGETTTALAFDADNATILAALVALPNIGTGAVTLGGGALPGTPVTVTFKLQWASQNVPLISINSGSLTGGGSYVPTETTPGVALTEVSLQPVSGNHWNLYVDTAAASFGNTKLTRALSCSWSISDMWGPLWVGNTANTSWVNIVPLKPTTEFRMMLEADSTGMAYLTQLRAGTKIFPRIEAIGALIEGSLYHRMLHDFCVLITNLESFGTDQGVTTVEWTGEIQHDATWGQALSLAQRSTITAL